MFKDSQLQLNIDIGGGEEREGKVKVSNLPKSFNLATIIDCWSRSSCEPKQFWKVMMRQTCVVQFFTALRRVRCQTEESISHRPVLKDLALICERNLLD